MRPLSQLRGAPASSLPPPAPPGRVQQRLTGVEKSSGPSFCRDWSLQRGEKPASVFGFPHLSSSGSTVVGLRQGRRGFSQPSAVSSTFQQGPARAHHHWPAEVVFILPAFAAIGVCRQGKNQPQFASPAASQQQPSRPAAALLGLRGAKTSSNHRFSSFLPSLERMGGVCDDGQFLAFPAHRPSSQPQWSEWRCWPHKPAS